MIKKNKEIELIFEISKLRSENERLKKLLSESKLGMKLATVRNEENANHFSKILRILDANGVKDLYHLNWNM